MEIEISDREIEISDREIEILDRDTEISDRHTEISTETDQGGFLVEGRLLFGKIYPL
jgi:hypothetical protein